MGTKDWSLGKEQVRELEGWNLAIPYMLGAAVVAIIISVAYHQYLHVTIILLAFWILAITLRQNRIMLRRHYDAKQKGI